MTVNRENTTFLVPFIEMQIIFQRYIRQLCLTSCYLLIKHGIAPLHFSVRSVIGASIFVTLWICICNESPPIIPICVSGTSNESTSSSKALASDSLTSTTIRDGDSLNSTTSSRNVWKRESLAPILPAIHISATVTDNPPSEQSCAERTYPLRIACKHAS